MTDPKKRLEEILKLKYCIYKNMGCDICSASCGIKEVITGILKEFVHKDNLPSIGKIGDLILSELKKQKLECINRTNIEMICLNRWFDLNLVAKAIRKLIEGKK